MYSYLCYILIAFVRQRSLQAYYENLTTENLVKHSFSSMIDAYIAQDSNGIFLPLGATKLKIW